MVLQPVGEMTIEAFDRYALLPENRERRFELINGMVVEKMPTLLHAAVVHLISGFLFMFLRQNPIGRVYVEARYQLPDSTHNARIPDLSFVSGTDRAVLSEGPAPYMPDMAVEVKSPDDTYREIREKAVYYLEHGTRLVWLVYPEKRLVIALTNDSEDILTDVETLDGGEVLPGFTLAVKDIFPV